MTDQNFEDKILQTIKEHKLMPTPRWQFLLKDYLVWTLAVIALLVGSLAVAVIIHLVQNNDWTMYERIDDTLLGFVLMTLPYFWLVCLLAFIGLGYYNFQHTKRGYRLPFQAIVLGNIAISLALGTMLYYIGIGQAIDEAMTEAVPAYGQFINPRRMRWSQPQRGVLAGVIITIENKNNFSLVDFNGQQWTVQAQNALVPPHFVLMPNQRVRMIGQRIDYAIFMAERIMPWIEHETYHIYIIAPAR